MEETLECGGPECSVFDATLIIKVGVQQLLLAYAIQARPMLSS